MTKANWIKSLEEVLKEKTKQKTLVSENSGNEYTTDVIPILNVLSVGSIEEENGKYKYSIVDNKNNLEYTIKTANKVSVEFGTALQFKNVRGGATANGNGWFAADSVAIVEK